MKPYLGGFWRLKDRADVSGTERVDCETEISWRVEVFKFEFETVGGMRGMSFEVLKVRTMVVVLFLFLISIRRADKVRRWLTELKQQTKQSDQSKELLIGPHTFHASAGAGPTQVQSECQVPMRDTLKS